MDQCHKGGVMETQRIDRLEDSVGDQSSGWFAEEQLWRPKRMSPTPRRLAADGNQNAEVVCWHGNRVERYRQHHRRNNKVYPLRCWLTVLNLKPFMTFQKEPPHKHGSVGRSAIVLVNLGTPDAPTRSSVRRYLKQFLSDPRVVEIPRAVWWFILNLIILPFRSGQSAKNTLRSGPVKVRRCAPTRPPRRNICGALGERGHQDLTVAMAMRYGSPSLPDVLSKLKADGAERILLLPAYPQYSGTTTGSIYDAVFQHYGSVRNIPSCASCATITTTTAISARCSIPCSTTGSSTAARKSW
jgi:hypothetical protein